MSESETAPRPWEMEHGKDGNGGFCEWWDLAPVDCSAYVGRIYDPTNASLIVRAVNAHEALLEACQVALQESIGQPSGRISEAGLAVIRAAIAKATATAE